MPTIYKVPKCWHWITISLLFSLLNACSIGDTNQINDYQFQTKDGPAIISNLQQTKYLLASNYATADIHYQLDTPSTTNEPVDILILFDRTNSMKREISETAKAAKTIVKDIQKSAPNTRFAVAAISDYSPLFTKSADTRTWLLLSNFTHSADKIARASNNIKLSSGGDYPEAYSRGLYEASMLNWRDRAKKLIIFFGDSVDHPIDPGRDEKLGTEDDLHMAMVTQKLVEKNIHVIGIYTDSRPKVVSMFKKLSRETGGQAKALSNASSSADTVIASIKKELNNNANLYASGFYQNWIKTERHNLAPNKTVYTIKINTPDNTDAGVYEIPLHFQSQDKENALVSGLSDTPMSIRVITGWYNHPLILWLPAISLLLLLVWRTLKMLRGGYNSRKSVTSSGHYNLSDYPAIYFFIDMLFCLSVICSGVAVYLCHHNLVLSQIL